MKVMVLGGGNCQLNMLKRLKNEGHYIILIDYLEANPGLVYADIHYQVSTFDTPAVTDILKDEKADAIVTMGTDQPVFTAASAAIDGDIPFYIEPSVARAVTNKQVMKRKFSKLGIPTADYRFIGAAFKDSEVSNLQFPAVLKPVDSQGQRGIFCVENIEEVRTHIKETLSYSREDVALLEEYYPNDEITVSGWVHDGRAYIISVVDRVTMEKDNRIGICIAHNYPSLHYTEYQKDIEQITQAIVTGFGIEEGPLYFQYLIGDRGVIVNEIAMRIGGAYEDIAIPLYSEIDILGLVFNSILGKRQNLQKLYDYDVQRNTGSLSVQMFFIKPGVVSYMTPVDELLALLGVEAALYIVAEGDKIGDIENATARAGYFIVRGADYIDTMNKVNSIFEKLQILDTDRKNLIIKYSDYKKKYKFIP